MASYPTEKMRSALLKFKVPLQDINKMSFSDASSMLTMLIDKAKAHDASSSTKSQGQAAPTQQLAPSIAKAKEAVELRLKIAKEVVDRDFPEAHDYSDYYALIAEVMHQLGAAVWLDKA